LRWLPAIPFHFWLMCLYRWLALPFVVIALSATLILLLLLVLLLGVLPDLPLLLEEEFYRMALSQPLPHFPSSVSAVG
jgi:hypothetical protein